MIILEATIIEKQDNLYGIYQSFSLANIRHRNFNNIQKYSVELSMPFFSQIRDKTHRDEKRFIEKIVVPGFVIIKYQ